MIYRRRRGSYQRGVVVISYSHFIQISTYPQSFNEIVVCCLAKAPALVNNPILSYVSSYLISVRLLINSISRYLPKPCLRGALVSS